MTVGSGWSASVLSSAWSTGSPRGSGAPASPISSTVAATSAGGAGPVRAGGTMRTAQPARPHVNSSKRGPARIGHLMIRLVWPPVLGSQQQAVAGEFSELLTVPPQLQDALAVEVDRLPIGRVQIAEVVDHRLPGREPL